VSNQNQLIMTMLEKEKYHLMRAIMNDTNEKRILTISNLYRAKPSFMCSAEELAASLPAIESEMAEGNCITQEEMLMTRKAI
jgi:hypothetical protein